VFSDFFSADLRDAIGLRPPTWEVLIELTADALLLLLIPSSESYQQGSCLLATRRSCSFPSIYFCSRRDTVPMCLSSSSRRDRSLTVIMRPQCLILDIYSRRARVCLCRLPISVSCQVTAPPVSLCFSVRSWINHRLVATCKTLFISTESNATTVKSAC
jgi:hypothetical protein